MTSGDYPTLLLTTPAPQVLLVTLNRPEAANAFNTQMARDLMALFEALALDHGETRCVVLTGSGTKAFCAGGDLKERNGMTDEAWARQHLIFERMIRAVIDCPLPIIGAVNGAAYGGGCEVAAAVDFLYAADTARFAQTETTLGIIPGAGGTQTLTRAIGERRAKELILSGRPFSAAEALAWGLVNAVYPPERLLEEALGGGRAHRRQRADRGAAGQAGDPSRPADVARRRARLRDRGLQPNGADGGPARRGAGLQREAPARIQGAVRRNGMTDRATVREVGLRDGLQLVRQFVPTEIKLDWCRQQAACGFAEIEVTSFVPPSVVPQFADAAEVLAGAKAIAGLKAAVLVPNLKGTQRALDCGAEKITYVLSASEAHNLANVRRTTEDSIAAFADCVAERDRRGLKGQVEMTGAISTAFGCTIQGEPCRKPWSTTSPPGSSPRARTS